MDGGAGVGYWDRLRALVFAAAAVLGLVVLLGTASSAWAAPPAPSFTTSPSPQAGQPVTFTASDSGAINYVWDFGDGSPSASSASPVEHTYSDGGVYNVTVTAIDTSGTTSQTTQQVGVIGPPSAAFNPTEATVLAGSPVAFDGTPSSDPDGSITGYSWNFGDGTGSGASRPSHSYTLPGTYNVTLRVTDNHGGSSSVTHQITAIAPPPVQTLVESVVPAPILIKFGSPSVAGHALVDLKERLFCPGNGPACKTTVFERRGGPAHDRKAVARAAASSVLTTPANGNAELAMHLTAAQWKALVKNHHISVVLTLVSARGAEKVTSTLRFKLHRG